MNTNEAAPIEQGVLNAMDIQLRTELARLSHDMMWFNRAIKFAGNDKLTTVIRRLNDLFPKEVVPSWVAFVELFNDYLRDEFTFYKEAQADPCEYCDLYEPDEPMIEEINTFLANNKCGAPKRYTPEFATWLRGIINE